MAELGSIWRLATGEVAGVKHVGDQAGFDLAKSLVAADHGLIQLGPGTESIVLGSGLDDICLVRIWKEAGIPFLGISRLGVADGADPSKILLFDASGIATGTKRTAIVRNHGGYLLLPAGEGSSGQFLKSLGAGTQPIWDAVPAVSNALLDGTIHTDTLNEAVQAGDLVRGNATPKWSRLGIGSAGQVLTVVGGLPAWSAVPSALEHNALFHLKPFSVANCTWTNSSDLIQTTGGAFANVRIGDFVICGNNSTAGNIGRRVIAINSTNEIQVNATNSSSTLSGVTLLIQPGDHWDDALAQDSFGAGMGLLFSAGRGTYSATGPGATFQEMRGAYRWMSHGSGSISSDFRAQGSTSTSTPFGFCLDNPGANRRVYFHINDLTGTKVVRFGDPANASFFFFSSAGKAYLDDSLMSVARTLTVKNLAGQITVRNHVGSHTISGGTNLTTQTITAPPPGLYRWSYYIEVTTPGTGSVNVNLNWTDAVGARGGTAFIDNKDMTNSNLSSGSDVIRVASGNITYDTSGTWTGVATIHIAFEAL